MNMKVIVSSTFGFMLLCWLAGCQGGGTNTSIPPYGSYLAFEDKAKGIMLLDGKIRFDRVDLNDSSKVLYSRVGRTMINTYFSSEKYVCIFLLGTGSRLDTVVSKGVNRFKISYSDRRDVDWLDFYLRSSEGALPEQVTFNGKNIPKIEADEPVSPSFLYVLK